MVVGGGNYVFSVTLAHVLAPKAYGVLALVQSFLLFAAWFTAAGFPWSAARRLARTDDAAEQASVLKGALLGNLVVATALALLLLALLAAGLLKLGDESGTPLLLAAGACSLSGVNAAAKGGLQGLLRLRLVALSNLAETAVKLGGGVGLAAAGWGASGGALGILAGSTVATLLSLSALRSVPLLRTRGFGGVQLYRETVPIFVGTAGMALLTSLDLFAVKLLSPESRSNVNTGLYQAGVTLARIPYFFASALTTAVFPHIARTRDLPTGAGGEGAALYVRKGVLFTVALLAPISLAMVTEPEAVLRAFFPGQYLAAAPALRTIAVGTTFLALAAFLVGALQAAGRDRLPAVVVLSTVVVEAAALAVGILQSGDTRHELIAAGVGFDIAAIAAALSLWVAAWRTFDWQPHPRGALGFAVAAAGFVATLHLLPHDRRTTLLLACLVASGVYLTLARCCGLLSRGDVHTLRSGLPF